MLNEREKELSGSVEEEPTAPKAAVMMDRPEEKQEEMSVNNNLEGTETARNVVIFSDSMAKYTQQYLSSYEFSYHVVAHRGAQIHDVSQNIREFSAIDDSTIAAVVLHVGTNNLCNFQTMNQNVQDYRDLLRVAVDRFPNAGILVSGILPRFDSEDLNNAARMYNIILAQLCTTFADKVKFVDLGSHFRSDHFFAIDGLHLSYQGNPRFAAKLQEAVEYHFSTDPEHIRWKEAFKTGMQKVPFPKSSLLGPRSAAKVEETSPKVIKPKLLRRCVKSVKRKVKELTRARRKCWYPKQEKKCGDVSDWTGWTRCQGPTAACSPSGNGPKWKTEYLIRTNCCLYQRHKRTPQSRQPEGNTKRGKKRKKLAHSKVAKNPSDLDMLEELLAEFAGQSGLCQDSGPRPRKRKRKCSGGLWQESQDHSVQQKDSRVSSPSTDVNHPATHEAEGQNMDLHDDRCPSYPVYIQTWDGHLLTVDVADNSTVTELHEAAAKFYKNGLPKEASFYRGGLKVKENIPLKHQDIVAESTLQVLLVLKGGGDKGDPGASGEAKPRHMTEWKEDEAVQWMQTVGKMRLEEVKPLVEGQVDGLALWGMTVDSLKKHFSCLSGGATIKLRNALKKYKEIWPNFEYVTLPDELPANVTCWREKEIRFWLSYVVKFSQNDVDSVCALELDGDSLLMLDEETAIEYLPKMKKGPLIKLLFCLEKLNLQQSKQKTEIVDKKGGVDETASDIPDDDVAQSLANAENYTNKTKRAFVDLSATRNESKDTLALGNSTSTTEENSRAKSAFTDKTDVLKDDVAKSQVVPSAKDVEPKTTLSFVTSGCQETDKEPISTLIERQASYQKSAQVLLAQASSEAVKLTEKEESILHLLKTSGLKLYHDEPQLTGNAQKCEISVIYARPKKKNEMDLSFNFLVIRKVQDRGSNTSHTQKLWDTIRKKLIEWVEFLPQKSRKEYYVDKKAASSGEYVFRCKDKIIISLSKKDPTCIPLGQVDIAVLKSMKAASTILIVEESFTTEEPQEYITACVSNNRKYYFQYCINNNWHAFFDEENLKKGLVMKANVMTAKSNLVPLEKESVTDKKSPSNLPHSQIELPDQRMAETAEIERKEVTTSKSMTELKEGVEDSSVTDAKLLGPEEVEKSAILDDEQTSDINDSKASYKGTLQSTPFTQLTPATPSTASTKASSGPHDLQEPFPFGWSISDEGKMQELKQKQCFPYRKGALFPVIESGSGHLLSACHEFKVFQQIKSNDQKIPRHARTYFLEETFRFAAGCINARRNGTIHFGVGDDVDKEKKYQHGEIVGIALQERVKAKFDDAIKDSIPTYFKQDWAISAVDQCIYPVRFIPVDEKDLDTSQSDKAINYVIEVDVEPTFAITQDRAFFFCKSKKQGECLYFRNRASTVSLTGSELDNFQHNLLQNLVQQRKDSELDKRNNSNIERPYHNNEYNAKRLKGCLLGGETDLGTKYPILFVSKQDFHSQDIESELSFIAQIPWTAIFDLDPNSDGSGICQLFKSKMKKECSLYQPEQKFFHISDHEELADAIIFPEKICWIFANGRHALKVEPHEANRWNGTERCKAVKNAISFFARPDKIPPGKAVIVFLVLSEEIEIMVNCFRYCFDDFCGIDNFLCLFEKENTYKSWGNQVQGVCNLEDLETKSIVSMPWAHINQTVKFINGFQAQTEPHIPTSSGSYVLLTSQFCNKLDDLEVLSKNQCEDVGLDPQSDQFEELCQKKEMMFYKGNEVNWLNFFFTDVHSKNHVMTRNNFSELQKLVSTALFHREPQLKRKSVIMRTLYYQAGSGATTLGKHILWAFRKNNVRCCVIQRITDDTAKQILDLRFYGEENENECFPVLMLIDNKKEEHVQSLRGKIEWLITNKGIISEKPVCIILQCKRTQDANTQHDKNPTDSQCLEQKVSEHEMRWLEKKQKELEKTILHSDMSFSYESDSDTENDDAPVVTATGNVSSNLQTSLNLDKDPNLFIKFMILRKNFDPEFVKNVVANSLNDIKGNELLLLCYTALLNVFAKEESFLPLHCAEALMGIDKSRHLKMSGILSPAVRVFLILVERLTCGTVQGYKVVDPVIAREVLAHMVKMQETYQCTYSSIACDFLESRLFSDAYTTNDLKFFTKEMLKHRKKLAYIGLGGMKEEAKRTQFSLIVEFICREEGYQKAVTVLQKGFKKFLDPMIAQVLARLFTKYHDFVQAHKYAKIAVDMESGNSFLLVTAGKVYHEEMVVTFEKLDKRKLTLSMLQNMLCQASSAAEHYSKSQEANRKGKHEPNLLGYLQDIKVCFRLLSMIKQVNPFIGKDGQAMLHNYLVDPEFVPDEVHEVWKDYHKWVKSIKCRIDVCIDFLEKDLTYNKRKTKDLELEWLKESFYQQVRMYPGFFGMLENIVIASDDERKRLQACTLLEGHKVNFSRTFDYIRKGRNAVPNLERVMDLLKGITEPNTFDLEGLISVSLALATVDSHSKKIPPLKQVYDWSVLLATLAPSTLEPHFFLTMFLCPREDMDIGFDAGLFNISKERLPTLYKSMNPKSVVRHVQAYKRMATTSYTRPMPATSFFLSKERGLQSFIHISCFVESQKNFDRDQFWENHKVQTKLRRLDGICLDRNMISFAVKGGPSVEIRSSRPIMIKGGSQDKVSFFLGFTWEGPRAYHVKVYEDW